MKICIALIICLVVVQMITIGFLGRAIENLVNNEIAPLGDYQNVTAQLAQQQQTLTDYKGRIQKLERQLDIMMAAARSGWGEAYRLIRTGALEDVE